MDKEVRQKVSPIFEKLRKPDPSVKTRKTDRLNVEQMLLEHEENEIEHLRRITE